MANPVANEQNQFALSQHLRVTFLTSRFLRLEYTEAPGHFIDTATLMVCNRHTAAVPGLQRSDSEGQVTLCSPYVTVVATIDDKPLSVDNLRITIRTGEHTTTEWWPEKDDPENLGGTFQTLDACDGSIHRGWKGILSEQRKPPHGLLSRSGWACVPDSTVALAADGWLAPPEAARRQDLYLLAYGDDFLSALSDAALVFGRQPLLPRYAFGFWAARWWPYTAEEFLELSDEMDRNGVPCEVFCIDMDWHREGWTGFSWEPTFFPRPAEFLADFRTRNGGLRLCMNLHPADGIHAHEDCYADACKLVGQDPAERRPVPFDVTSRKAMDAYFQCALAPHEKLGVDFWWLDWQQDDTYQCQRPGLSVLTWLNHLHWQSQSGRALPHAAQASPPLAGRDRQRALFLSRFGGLGSGRSPVGFSGDTYISWASLDFQPLFTALANNSLYGYWSHDTGGHFRGELTPELFTRWWQWCCFAPILRLHSVRSLPERWFWRYAPPHGPVMYRALIRRLQLLPYIYTEAYKCHRTGVSLCHPLYLHHPRAEAAYGQGANAAPGAEYCFGDHLLVRPVTAPIKLGTTAAETDFWLPQGEWVDLSTLERLVVSSADGQLFRRRYLISECPSFARNGTILPGQIPGQRIGEGSFTNLTATVIAAIYPEAPALQGRYEVYEDDGVSEEYRELDHPDASARILLWFGAAWPTLTVSVKLANTAPPLFRGFTDKRSFRVLVPGNVPPGVVRHRVASQQAWEPVPFSATIPQSESRLPTQPRITEEQPCWWFDGTNATTVIALPSISVITGHEIQIEYLAADAGLAATGLWGIPGLISRFRESFNAARWMRARWERVTAMGVKTADQLSRHPREFAQHVNALLATTLPTTEEEEFEIAGKNKSPDEAKSRVQRFFSSWAETLRFLAHVPKRVTNERIE